VQSSTKTRLPEQASPHALFRSAKLIENYRAPTSSFELVLQRRFVSPLAGTICRVRAYQLFSRLVRSDCHVSCSLGPGQLNMSDGVMDWIALASVGGVEGSFFTAQRPLP
jgi:hypothetical protein